MNESKQRWASLGMLVLVGTLAGCSGQKELAKKDTIPVNGKVVSKDEPVRFVLLEFQPADTDGAPATGQTGEEGSFSLRTYSNTEPDGIVPGKYKVRFEKWNVVKAGALPEDAKPTEITDEMKAGVEVEIKPEDTEVEIKVP